MTTPTTKADDGGAAFPCPPGILNQGAIGMSLRDWFAGQALAGMMADPESGEHPALWAACAYEHADAMLAARASIPENVDIEEPISVLDLPTRAMNVLERLGCKTVADVTRLDELDLAACRGSGRTTRRIIVRALADRGLSLASRKAGPQ